MPTQDIVVVNTRAKIVQATVAGEDVITGDRRDLTGDEARRLYGVSDFVPNVISVTYTITDMSCDEWWPEAVRIAGPTEPGKVTSIKVHGVGQLELLPQWAQDFVQRYWPGERP